MALHTFRPEIFLARSTHLLVAFPTFHLTTGDGVAKILLLQNRIVLHAASSSDVLVAFPASLQSFLVTLPIFAVSSFPRPTLQVLGLYLTYLIFFFFFFFCLSVFLELHLRHVEVSRLGVESDLLLPAYATATATRDP